MEQPKVKNHQIEKEIAGVMVSAILDQSEKIDKLSTWLLGGVGAGLIVFISNIDKFINSIGTLQAQVIISAFAISLLFGLTKKYLAYLISVEKLFEQKLLEKEEYILNKYGEGKYTKLHEYIKDNADSINIISLFISAFPIVAQKFLLKKFLEDSPKDLSEKKAYTNILARQFIFTLLQLLIAILSVPIIVMSI